MNGGCIPGHLQVHGEGRGGDSDPQEGRGCDGRRPQGGQRYDERWASTGIQREALHSLLSDRLGSST